MNIHGLIVSVGYGKELEKNLSLWADGLSSICIVTSHDDAYTKNLSKPIQCQTRFCVTDAFYRHGAHFNKGAAMCTAVDQGLIPVYDWILCFDADITPPKDWKSRVELLKPMQGNLYGAHRVDSVTKVLMPDQTISGYFMLFHGYDPRAMIRPMFPDQYTHAGNYDSEFVERWPANQCKMLDLVVAHEGVAGQNWCGVGNDTAMSEIRSKRKKGRKWRDEVIGN